MLYHSAYIHPFLTQLGAANSQTHYYSEPSGYQTARQRISTPRSIIARGMIDQNTETISSLTTQRESVMGTYA